MGSEFRRQFRRRFTQSLSSGFGPASLDRGSRHRRRGRSPTALLTMKRRERTEHVHSLELGLSLGLEVESARKGGRLSTPLRGFAMTSSGERSKGPGTCKHRRARNCPTHRDPCGQTSRPGDSQIVPHLLDNARNRVGNGRADATLTRDHDEVLVMAARLGSDCRPEKSLQALEMAQNGLEHDRSGPVRSRGPRPSTATGSATRPRAASPQSRRLASRSCPELKMAPQAVENAQNGLGNGEAGTRARPTFPTHRPRRTAESPCGRPAMTRPGSRSEAETPPASLGRAVAPKPPSGSGYGDLQMASHLLENTRNRLGNGRPRELDRGSG